MSEEKEQLPLEYLEKKGALQIPVFLYEWKGTENPTISDITREVRATRTTVLSTIEMLKRLKLAEDFENPQFPFEHTVWLTDLGKAVAKELVKVARSLRHLRYLERDSNV